MEWKPHLSLPKPKRKKPISKEELVSSHPEQRTGSGGLPKRKNSFPEEEPTSDLKRLEIGVSPRKRGNSLRRSIRSAVDLISSGPEAAAGSRSGSSKKHNELQKLSQEEENGQLLVG